MKRECDDSETTPIASLQAPTAATGESMAKLQRVIRLPVMYPRLQRLCRPQSESFWVLGGRPGAFKTSLLWNLALNAAERKMRVLFATLEMTPGEMGLLAVSRFSGLTRDRIERAFMSQDRLPFNEEELERFRLAERRLASLDNVIRLHGAAAHGRSVDQLIRSATRARFDAVFVDHLGMIGRDSGGRELDLLSHAIHRLRGLSRGEESPGHRPWVCVTSQLNREIDKGDVDRIPRLADFRGSARIEHDADVAIGLQKRGRIGDESVISALDGFVLKNRHGPCPAVLCFEANGATGLITERHTQGDSPPPHFSEGSDED
jgi:replicative DNA helicase